MERETAVKRNPLMPCIALYPLKVLRPMILPPEEARILQNVYAEAVWLAGVPLPDEKRQQAALETLKHRDSDDACLAQLAQLLGTSYAMCAQVDITEDGLATALARLVRDDGTCVIEMERNEKVPMSQDESFYEHAASIVLLRLFKAMELEALLVPKKTPPGSPPSGAKE